jgi:hypothetical protein
MSSAPKVALSILLAALPLAPAARAQEVSLRLGTSNKHGTFALEIGRGSSVRCEPHPAPARLWVPGRYETRCERVWVPGCERREWVPPRYEWVVEHCGIRRCVLVREGYWRVVQEPGRYETREVRVWVPGRWEIGPKRY